MRRRAGDPEFFRNWACVLEIGSGPKKTVKGEGPMRPSFAGFGSTAVENVRYPAPRRQEFHRAFPGRPWR